MWNNMGERLQKLAKVLCWVGIVCFTFLGLYRIADNGVNVLERIVRIAGAEETAGALQGDRHSVTFSSRMMTEYQSRGHAPAAC